MNEKKTKIIQDKWLYNFLKELAGYKLRGNAVFRIC